MNILITGVSKGIGLALTDEALEKGHHVFGVARHPEESHELMQLQKKNNRLTIIKLDLKEENAAEKLIKALANCSHIDILINNAGIYEKDSTKEAFIKSFEVNAYIPFMVTETLVPKLKPAHSPKVIHITSLMGSIEDNSSGGSVAYRASKTALNMIHKCLSLEHNWLSCMAIHPGWVQTSMGGKEAPTTPKQSVSGIWKEIERLTLAESGCFKDFQGNMLPW